MEDDNKKEIDGVTNQIADLQRINKQIDILKGSEDKIFGKIEKIESNINELKKYAKDTYEDLTKKTNRAVEQTKTSADCIKKDISDKISDLGKSFDETRSSLLPKLSEELNGKITESINATQKLGNEIALNINKLETPILSINSSLSDVLKKLPETERKYGEIKALYEKEQEISYQRANRIKELNNDLEEERVRSSQLNKSLSEKNNELTKLKEQKESVEKEKIDLEKSLLETRNTLNKTEKGYFSLKEEKDNLVQELNDIKSRYENLNIDDNLILAYNEYSSLSSKTKDNLNSIFQQRTFLGFISCGLRLSNVTALWEFAKRNAFNNILDDITILNHIFCILIEVYNAGFNEKQYDLITPSVGTKFDSSSSSERTMKPDGTVQEVFLAGYRSIKEGNLHKAVVGV